jgi:hypothetical protein
MQVDVEGSGAWSVLPGEAFVQKDIKERIGRWYMQYLLRKLRLLRSKGEIRTHWKYDPARSTALLAYAENEYRKCINIPPGAAFMPVVKSVTFSIFLFHRHYLRPWHPIVRLGGRWKSSQWKIPSQRW